MSQNQGNGQSYTKGFVLGAIIGGAVGAITALLLAPKSGKELRQDIAQKSGELYNKAEEIFSNVESSVSGTVGNVINEGKIKAERIISTAKNQAGNLMEKAEAMIHEAKAKASNIKETVQDKYDTLKQASRAGADAFRAELKTEDDI